MSLLAGSPLAARTDPEQPVLAGPASRHLAPAQALLADSPLAIVKSPPEMNQD